MPTKIRLQQHGVRNHPYWWIIVQGPNRNARGKLIEHMGFWIPRQCATVDRAIILNRPRLKYWLSTGAVPTAGVWKLLQWTNFLPRRPPAYGTATLYAKPEKKIPVDKHPLFKRLGGALASRINEVEQVEEHIANMRKQYEKNAATWAGYSKPPGPGEMTVEEMEKLKTGRELENLFEGYAALLRKFDQVVPNATNEQRLQMLLSFISNEEDGLMEPFTAEGIAEELGITLEEGEQIEEMYDSIRQHVTSSDIDDMKEDLQYKGRKSLTEGKIYIPSPNTITPVPDFDRDEFSEFPKQLLNTRNSLRSQEDSGARLVPEPLKKLAGLRRKLHPGDRWNK